LYAGSKCCRVTGYVGDLLRSEKTAAVDGRYQSFSGERWGEVSGDGWEVLTFLCGEMTTAWGRGHWPFRGERAAYRHWPTYGEDSWDGWEALIFSMEEKIQLRTTDLPLKRTFGMDGRRRYPQAPE
jgi:hypothetical protein